MFKRKKNELGFTLIELLLAISLVAIVGLAIYGIFDSGIKVMRKIIRPVPGEDLNIFFEKLSQDLQNSFHYKDIRFRGEAEKVIFAATVQTRSELGADEGIGEVTYAYDPGKLVILREQKNMSEIYREKEEKKEGKRFEGTLILERILSMSFQYYGLDPVEKEYLWQKEWEEMDQKIGLPFAVRVEIDFEEEGEKRHLTRTITIPVSG